MFGISEKYVSEDKLSLTLLKRDFGSTSVTIGFNKGSFHQPKDKPGVAHFAEHMLVKESKNYPDLSSTKTKLTSLGIFSNAHVGLMQSKVVFNVPDNNDLATALDIFFDNILNPLVLEERLEKERNAIITEIRGNKQDVSFYSDTLLLNAIAGIDTTDYSFNGGDEEVIKTITAKDIKEFMQKNYTRENIRICVVGNIDIPHIKNIIEKKTRLLKSQTKLQSITNQSLTKTGSLQLKYNISDTKVNILKESYCIRSITPLDAAFVELLRRYLVSTPSAYLPGILRVKYGLIYGVFSSSVFSRDRDYITINYQITPEKYDEFISQKQSIYKELSSSKLDEELFDVTKNFILKIANKWFEASDELRNAFTNYRITDKPFDYSDMYEALQTIEYGQFCDYTAKVFSQVPIASVEVT